MRRTLVRAASIACVLVALCYTTGIASAKGQKRFTLEISPVYITSTNGDATAPPPPGWVGLGYSSNHPKTSDLRLDYGLTYLLNRKTSLYYSHSNFAFAMGRVLTVAPALSLVTSDTVDRTDTLGIKYSYGHGLELHAYYWNHAREYVAGFCLNQEACPDNNGKSVSNPASIDEHGYAAGFTYNFGPVSRTTGPLFTVGLDAKYVPRPSTPPTSGVDLGGLPAYVGSQWMFPYSMTVRPPISKTPGLIPFIGYERASVLYRNEATPEVYNAVDWGFVKVLPHHLIFSYVNLNFMGCKCSDTVPAPDNVRFADGIFKLTYSLHF